MRTLLDILLFLHIVGAAMIVGIWIGNMKKPTVHPRQRDGAFLQLITGIAMMGLLPLMPDADPNYPKLGIKLVIGVAVAVLAVIGSRKYKKSEPISKGLAHSVGGLALLNVAIATLWN
jgi:multisubunit Na+/H+ antiporter MnhB subunit